MTRRLLTAMALATFAFAAPARAADVAAGERDLQQLQYELENLDQLLQNVTTSDPSYPDLKQRVDWLHEDVRRLEERIRTQHEGRGAGPTRDEVMRVRDRAAALQQEITSTGDPQALAGTVPEGTEVQLQLESALSSRTARPEDRVEATVARPVTVDGRLVIPAGTQVEGVVEDVSPAQTPSRAGHIELDFERLRLDGRTLPLRSRVVSVGEERFTRRSAERAGIGAALGGVLGAVIGGKRGAVVGVIVGAAGGLAASEGRDIELPAGTLLTVRLERPVALSARN